MKSFLIFAFMLALSAASCRKQQNQPALSGLFTESSPVEGRGKINFISSTMLAKYDLDPGKADTFYYEVMKKSIRLTPAWSGSQQSSELYFNRISDTKFEIENLYAGIPEQTAPNMIFEK